MLKIWLYALWGFLELRAEVPEILSLASKVVSLQAPVTDSKFFGRHKSSPPPLFWGTGTARWGSWWQSEQPAQWIPEAFLHDYRAAAFARLQGCKADKSTFFLFALQATYSLSEAQTHIPRALDISRIATLWPLHHNRIRRSRCRVIIREQTSSLHIFFSIVPSDVLTFRQRSCYVPKAIRYSHRPALRQMRWKMPSMRLIRAANNFS
jgi:hypothetical protein